jgi:ribose-phosphate pyrophosphokinase
LRPIVFALHGHEDLCHAIAERLGGEVGKLILRRFPDGETYLRLETGVEGCPVILVCSMNDPDPKILQLYFCAVTARELGATAVGLIVPYLTYMRQDTRFQPGEAITSSSFASLLCGFSDWLVTVDPHLHRHASLAGLYTIPATVVHAAPAISDWIRMNIESPILIGPDEESAQWVAEVARGAAVPYAVLQKVRKGDRDVEVSIPDVEAWRSHTPVLVDDIISTGRTMMETLGHLQRTGMKPAVCIGVHAVFAEKAYEELMAAGAVRIITCNTISHRSNAVDLSTVISAAAAENIAAATAIERRPA